MTIAMTVAGVRALSVRLLLPERGAWIADVDLDPDAGIAMPTGQVALTVGATTLTGTVDARASGRFVSGMRMRIVAGGGGWDATVKRQYFHNDAGVKTAVVYAQTAALVGETVNDAAPQLLGVHWWRAAGPASSVFADRAWFVDLAGVTQTGARPAATPDSSLEILGYDAAAQRLEVACDGIVVPGTTFSDSRFDGTLTAREVEQVFSPEGGARATVFCASGASAGLADVLRSAVETLGGLALLRVYRYRFGSAGPDGRLNLQAVEKGAPDLTPVEVWPGMAGLTAKLSPSQIVLVAFVNGDASMPIVVGFDGQLPNEVTIDAKNAVHIAPSGGTPRPIARAGDAVQVYADPTALFAGFINGTTPVTGTITFVNPLLGIILEGSAKADCA